MGDAAAWLLRLTTLLLLELTFGVAFYVSSIFGAGVGLVVVWFIDGWMIIRGWELQVAIALASLGAIAGGAAWLTLRYTLIQPWLRKIGLAKPKRSRARASLAFNRANPPVVS
jgi:hypothetical protein